MAGRVDTDGSSIAVRRLSEKPRLVNGLVRKGAVGIVIAKARRSIRVENPLVISETRSNESY